LHTGRDLDHRQHNFGNVTQDKEQQFSDLSLADSKMHSTGKHLSFEDKCLTAIQNHYQNLMIVEKISDCKINPESD
jgi:hypothetical protein